MSKDPHPVDPSSGASSGGDDPDEYLEGYEDGKSSAGNPGPSKPKLTTYRNPLSLSEEPPP